MRNKYGGPANRYTEDEICECPYEIFNGLLAGVERSHVSRRLQVENDTLENWPRDTDRGTVVAMVTFWTNVTINR